MGVKVDFQSLSNIYYGDKYQIAKISNFIFNALMTHSSENGELRLKEPHELNSLISNLCEYKEGFNPNQLKADLLNLVSRSYNPEMLSKALGV